jgi:hypothetical protein
MKTRWPNYIWHWETPRRVTRSHPAIGQAWLSSTLHTTDKLLIGSNSVNMIDEPHPNTEFAATPSEATAVNTSSPLPVAAVAAIPEAGPCGFDWEAL